MASLSDLLGMMTGGGGSGGIGGIAGMHGGGAPGGMYGAIARAMGGGLGFGGQPGLSPAYGQSRQGLGGGPPLGQYQPGQPGGGGGMGPDWMRQMGQAATSTYGGGGTGRVSMVGQQPGDGGWAPLRQMLGPGIGLNPAEAQSFINAPGGPAELMHRQIAANKQMQDANRFTPYQAPWQGQLDSQFNSLMSDPGLWNGMHQAVANKTWGGR